MKFRLENDFSKHIKSPELLRVYLLMGEQPYLISKYRDLLLKKAVGGNVNDFNLHRFESTQLDMQAFYDAVESLPFFAESRCVTLSITDKLDASQIKELCTILSDPPDTTTIIITFNGTEGINELVKACDKTGAVISLTSRSHADTLRFLRDYAQKNGCILSSNTATYLIERCGDNLQLLTSETKKLCTYVGSGEISNKQIDDIVCAVLQARVFDLSKAIFRGNFNLAMELIDQLVQQREPIPKILSILSGAFVDLYRGYCIRQAGIDVGRAATELGYSTKREFVLKNAMSDSGRYHSTQLGEMLQVLAEADLRAKSTGTNDRIVLEHAVAELFILAGNQ